MVKNPPAMWETWVQSLDWEDPLEEGMASHSSILAWRILMDRSLAAYTPWIHKELDMTERLSTQYKPPYIESLSVSQILLSHLSYLRPFSAPATPCLKQSLFHSSND